MIQRDTNPCFLAFPSFSEFRAKAKLLPNARNRIPTRPGAATHTRATPAGAELPPEPTPEAAPEKAPRPAIEPVRAGAAAEPPTKHKARGLMRAIGGLFKRKASDADDAMAPSDSEASQRRTSRWSRWSHSHRGSLPEVPLEVAAENESAASSPHMEEPPAKKAKKAKQSPTDPSELLAADSSDESGAEPQRVSFLFFGGKRYPPSLQAKMPLFFSPPLVENMRRSSILPDPKEYEF
ncbi:hypothetical protein GQ600_9746 [Phytophthora cactorum]|nr:hypothetical protein GQ600_9746 [Phytophthora cactorum]